MEFRSLLPLPLRWQVWDKAQAVNGAISEVASGMANTTVIDTGSALMADGRPDDTNYVFDRLHLSKRCYAIWPDSIRSRVFSDLGLKRGLDSFRYDRRGHQLTLSFVDFTVRLFKLHACEAVIQPTAR